MKSRIVFLFFFMISISMMASAKKKLDRNTDVYIKAGLNFSNALDIKPNVHNKDFKTGFNIGLHSDTRLNHNLYFRTGISFTTKGVEFDYKGIEKSVNITQKYLQLPLTLAYKSHLQKKTYLVFNFGPYLAYGIGGKVDDDKPKKQNIFDKKGLKRFDVGLLGGIGFEFDRIFLGIDYEHGLLDITQAKKDSYKNQNISISLGYKF